MSIIQDAIESLRQIILDGRTSSEDIRKIEKMIYDLRNLDSFKAKGV